MRFFPVLLCRKRLQLVLHDSRLDTLALVVAVPLAGSVASIEGAGVGSAVTHALLLVATILLVLRGVHGTASE